MRSDEAHLLLRVSAGFSDSAACDILRWMQLGFANRSREEDVQPSVQGSEMQTQLAAQLLARYVTSAICWQNRLPQSWLHNKILIERSWLQSLAAQHSKSRSNFEGPVFGFISDHLV